MTATASLKAGTRKPSIMEDLKEQHWRIDKRISIGHLYTIVVILFTSIAWLVSLQFQIESIRESQKRDTDALKDVILRVQEIHNRDVARMDITDREQYSELIRRLESLQAQLNQLLKKPK